MKDQVIQGKLPKGFGVNGYARVPCRCRKCKWWGLRLFRYTVWGRTRVKFSTILKAWADYRATRIYKGYVWLSKPGRYCGGFYQIVRDCPACGKQTDPVLEFSK